MNLNRLILLFIPLFIAIPIGMFGCELWICGVTIPPLLFVAFTIILYVVIKVNEGLKLSLFTKIFSVLLIPLYLFFILFFVWMIMRVTLDIKNYNSWMRFDTRRIDPETILNDGENITYRNSDYNYQITFPKNWGFRGDGYTITLHPAGKEEYKSLTEIQITSLSQQYPLEFTDTNRITFKNLDAIESESALCCNLGIHFVRNNIDYKITILSHNEQLHAKYRKFIEEAFNFIE